LSPSLFSTRRGGPLDASPWRGFGRFGATWRPFSARWATTDLRFNVSRASRGRGRWVFWRANTVRSPLPKTASRAVFLRSGRSNDMSRPPSSGGLAARHRRLESRYSLRYGDRTPHMRAKSPGPERVRARPDRAPRSSPCRTGRCDRRRTISRAIGAELSPLAPYSRIVVPVLFVAVVNQVAAPCGGPIHPHIERWRLREK